MLLSLKFIMDGSTIMLVEPHPYSDSKWKSSKRTCSSLIRKLL